MNNVTLLNNKKGIIMKQLLFLSVMATTLLFGGKYTTNEASRHIGEKATICGMVSGGNSTLRYSQSKLADEVYEFFLNKLYGTINAKAKWTEV